MSSTHDASKHGDQGSVHEAVYECILGMMHCHVDRAAFMQLSLRAPIQMFKTPLLGATCVPGSTTHPPIRNS